VLVIAVHLHIIHKSGHDGRREGGATTTVGLTLRRPICRLAIGEFISRCASGLYRFMTERLLAAVTGARLAVRPT